MFPDAYVSINEATINKTESIPENIVCLKISNLTFSLLLSFMIDLYNLIPLIANANSTGINIIFWKSIEEKINAAPFWAPNVAIMLDILNPSEKPRKHTIAYTASTPNYCKPCKPQA